jgi:hypothetical protein
VACGGEFTMISIIVKVAGSLVIQYCVLSMSHTSRHFETILSLKILLIAA